MTPRRKSKPPAIPPRDSSRTKIYSFSSLARQGRTTKLVDFDKYGRIYFPAPIRRFFRGYKFSVVVSEGKIVLDPVEVDG